MPRKVTQFVTTLLMTIIVSNHSFGQVLDNRVNYKIYLYKAEWKIETDIIEGDPEQTYRYYKRYNDVYNNSCSYSYYNDESAICTGGTGDILHLSSLLEDRRNSAYNESMAMTIFGWEDDDILINCDFDTGDDDPGCINNINISAHHGLPVDANTTTGYNEIVYSTGSFDLTFLSIWRYARGNRLDNPLEFGIISPGETKYHTNAPKFGINAGADDPFGYWSLQQDDNPDDTPFPAIAYTFDIQGGIPAAKSVIISTQNAGSLADHTFYLYYVDTEDNTWSYIATESNHSTAENGYLQVNLCPGLYGLIVQSDLGSPAPYIDNIFELSIQVQNLPPPETLAGTIDFIPRVPADFGLCQNDPIPSILSIQDASPIYTYDFERLGNTPENLRDSYYWTSKTDGAWTVIPNQKGPSLDQSYLMGTKDYYFRRHVAMCGAGYPSNVISIAYEGGPKAQGAIALDGSPSILPGEDAGNIISTDDGYTSYVTHQWQARDKSTFLYRDIPDAPNSLTYDIPEMCNSMEIRRVTVSGCGFKTYTLPVVIEIDAQDASMNLSDYSQIGAPIEVPVNINDLSGIAFSPVSKTLFAVDNGTTDIIEMSLKGDILRTIELIGFEDTEGITYIKDEQFAVIEERQGKIHLIDINNLTTSININTAQSYLLSNDSWGTNNGLEGVTYDPFLEKIYLCKEKNPIQLYSIPLDELNQPTVTASLLNEVVLNLNANTTTITDLAGLAFGPNGHLILLSQESGVILEVDPITGHEISSLILPVTFDQAEGICFDQSGNMYIAGEPKYLYMYSPCGDFDLDGIADLFDNCPYTPNSDQGDLDKNGVGDVCETNSWMESLFTSSDDAEESGLDGGVSLTSLDLDMVYDDGDGANQTVGIRFADLGYISDPISRAYIQFTAEETHSMPSSLDIELEQVAYPDTYSAINFDISNRTYFPQKIHWIADSWPTINESGFRQKSPNLASLINTNITDYGNLEYRSLAFKISGSGDRTSFSFDNDPAKAPKLILETNKPCREHLRLFGNVDSGIYSARKLIQAKSMAASLQDIEFTAGESVELFAGFEIGAGTLFSIQMQGCE